MIARNEAAIVLHNMKEMHEEALSEWRSQLTQAVPGGNSASCQTAPTDAATAAAAALVTCNSRCYYAYKTLRRALNSQRHGWQKQLSLTQLLIRSKQVKSTELWAHHGAVMHEALACQLQPQHHHCLSVLGRRSCPAAQPSAAASVDGLKKLLSSDFSLTLTAATAHRRISYAWQHRWKLSQICINIAFSPCISAASPAGSAASPHSVPAAAGTGAVYNQDTQSTALQVLLLGMSAVEDWLRMRPGDHSAWHWCWTTTRALTQRCCSPPRERKGGGETISQEHSALYLHTSCALWARQLLLLSYVNEAHSGHSGLEAAARNAIIGACECLMVCTQGCGADEEQCDAYIKLLDALLDVGASPSVTHNTFRALQWPAAAGSQVTGGEPSTKKGGEGASQNAQALPCRPAWADGVVLSLAPGSALVQAACAALEVTKGVQGGCEIGEGRAGGASLENVSCPAALYQAMAWAVAPCDWLQVIRGKSVDD